MKSLLIFLSFITFSQAESAWVMTKCSSPLSYYVDFNYLKEDVLTDKVVRSGLLTPRYYYDLYSSEGTLLVRAVNRVFSLGFFSPSCMEFDIYDEMDTYIGYIGGKFWTNGKARFQFTNADGEEVGSAFLSSDFDRARFSIVSATGKIVAKLEGDFAGDLSHWELDVEQPFDIDPRILKIFAAFTADHHSSFIKPILEYDY